MGKYINTLYQKRDELQAEIDYFNDLIDDVNSEIFALEDEDDREYFEGLYDDYVAELSVLDSELKDVLEEISNLEV